MFNVAPFHHNDSKAIKSKRDVYSDTLFKMNAVNFSAFLNFLAHIDLFENNINFFFTQKSSTTSKKIYLYEYYDDYSS